MPTNGQEYTTTTPLAGMERVPWHQLKHAYGPADDVPEMLRRARDPEQMSKALGDLSTSVYHQGGCVYSAATATLPFLVEFAADATSPERVNVLELIGDIGRAGRKAEPRWVDSAWPDAWAAAVPRLLPLLSDPDVAVRRHVAYPLAQAVEAVEVVVPALRERWATEADAAARLGLVFAVGQLLRHATYTGRESTLAWLARLMSEVDDAQRLAAAVSLRRATRTADPTHAQVAMAVLVDGDLGAWADAWCGPNPRRMTTWVDQMLGNDRDGRTSLALAMLARPEPARRTGGLEVVAEVTSRWRSPLPDLLAEVAARLTDTEPENRTFAVHLLAAFGAAATPVADDLVAACDDVYLPAADAAVWALARQRDPRCLAPLVDRLTPGRRLGFALAGACGPGWFRWQPDVVDVLGTLADHADQLLPAVRGRLRAATSFDERRAFARALITWGPVAAPAIPELQTLVADPHLDTAVWGWNALAAIGPAAAAAVPPSDLQRLRTLNAQDLSHSQRSAAALAYWHLTRDPQPVLDQLPPDLDGPYGTWFALPLVIELGPYADMYEDRLRELLHSEYAGIQLKAAVALWRITGDPSVAIGWLIRTVRTAVDRGQAGLATIEAITQLGEIGRPAAEAVPLLEYVLTTDRRLSSPGDWRSISRDDALYQAAAKALISITTR